MKVANLFHNPKAGDSLYDKDELTSLLTAGGFKCVYISTKDKKWPIEDNADLNIIAGGDGTVRKVVAYLVEKGGIVAPIALLPLGTANNIAGALGITGRPDEIIASWHEEQMQQFDMGRIYGLPDADFFLESIGCGIFANLMNAVKKNEHREKYAEKKLEHALRSMHEIATDYKERECMLEVDGVDHSGRYLMAEIMNINSIGPNLLLNPLADTSDGKFEIVLIKEEQREQLLRYLDEKIHNPDMATTFHAIQGSHIKIQWEGLHVHVDDKIVKVKKEIQAEIEAGVNKLRFIK